LSDEVADVIGQQLLSNSSASLMIVVSKSKIQGVLNTCSMSKELSNSEMLNLIVKVRSLHLNDKILGPSWSSDLCFHRNKSEAIVKCFSNMVFNSKLSDCQFKLKIIEKDTMIAQMVGLNDIVKDLSADQSLTSIYLSGCTLSYTEYETLLQRCTGESSLSILYILHSFLRVDTICTMLSRNNRTLTELFVHSNCTVAKDDMITLLSFFQHTSVVIITNNTLTVHNPTNKQLALTCQLELSVNVWRFLCCQVSADCFLFNVTHTYQHY